jgi:hypothetical protein
LLSLTVCWLYWKPVAGFCVNFSIANCCLQQAFPQQQCKIMVLQPIIVHSKLFFGDRKLIELSLNRRATSGIILIFLLSLTVYGLFL